MPTLERRVLAREVDGGSKNAQGRSGCGADNRWAAAFGFSWLSLLLVLWAMGNGPAASAQCIPASHAEALGQQRWVGLGDLSMDRGERLALAVPLVLPVGLTAQTVITSQPSTCMAIDGDGQSVKSASSKVLFVWQGQPSAANLVLASCGVKPTKNHTVYLNGQPVLQVDDDPFSSACICTDEGYSGQGGQTVSYALADAGIVLSGWNYISVTNDQDITDDWVAHGARLVLSGDVTQTVIGSFGFTSSYDGSSRVARYQVPIGYSESNPVPLLVSIAGTKEDQRWEDIYRFAMDANSRGWLLLSPNLRNLFGATRGRTASLPNQYDALDAIRYVQAHFAVDADRIYLSGFSTGGGVAATLAAKYPHVFAAVVDWAGPTDLGEWNRQVTSLVNLDFGCWPSGFANPCPFEWQRRSVRSMSENLKHVPMAIVHGRADDRVAFEQSEKLYLKMTEYYDPASQDKVTVWHDGGHADYLSSFDGLDWMSQFTLNANPLDLMIRADEDKSYYWIRVDQQPWIGKWRDGWSAVLASFDPGTRVISVTVQDQRLYENGFLPVDVRIDLAALGLDPGASYTVEDYNLQTGDYELRLGVGAPGGQLVLNVYRDAAGGVHHHYQIYPYPPVELVQLAFQQGLAPSPGYSGTRDTYIYQYAPGENYAAESSVSINYGRSRRALLAFDLSSIPRGSDIKKAQLTVYLNRVSGGGSIAVQLHGMLSDWHDIGATWTQAAAGQPWAAPGAQAAGSDYDVAIVDSDVMYPERFATFNIKPLVKGWVDDPASNRGLLLLGPELGSGSTVYRLDSSESADAGRRPRLDVWYMLATPTATATPSPTVTRTPTSTPTPTSTQPSGGALGGQVELQGRPPAPAPSWSVPLAVQIGGSAHVITTDNTGGFSIAGIAPGTYDVWVKNAHTLRNVRRGITIVAGEVTSVDFGLLREGDANDDNYVNIADFSLLATGFHPRFDPRADFNGDGQVNVADFSLLAANFGGRGD